MSPEDEQDRHKALEVAYRFLGKRDRTVAEVRQKLEKAGFGAEPSEAAIQTLLEQRYLDDARFARCFAEDRRTLDGWGAERIRQRLRGLGIERELASAAARRDARAEGEAALALLRRRFPTGLSDRDRDRALGMLTRRGYEFELACEAVGAHARGANAA